MKVYEGDKLLGETTVGPDGTWTMTLPGLAAGAHDLMLRLFSAEGKELAAQPLSITVPAAEALVTPGLTAEPAATVTSAPEAGATPETGKPYELTGIGAPGTTVKVYEGDKLLGETTVGSDGTWTMTLPGLAAGAHDLMLRLFSAEGKELAAQPLSITVPAAEALVTPGLTAEPAATVTSAPEAGATPETGKPYELTGIGAPGTTVKVFEGDKLLGETKVGSDGTWRMTLPGLVAGAHDLMLRLFSAEGKELAAQPLSITVPEVKPSPIPTARPSPAPATQAIVTITWPPNGSTVGSSRPLFTGQAFPRGVVRLMDGNMLLGEAVVDSAGNWSFRPQAPLTPGRHTVTAVATSPDGQTILQSDPVSFTVPASAAFAPVKRVTGTVAPSFAQPAPGGVLSTLQPLFSGTATPNSVVRLYDGDNLLGEAVADADGQWSFRPSAPLSPGEHTITAVAMNADGTEEALRTTLKLSVAGGLGNAPLQPPILTGGLPATLSNNRPTFSGQGTPGTTVRIYDGDTLLGEAIVGADGRWYFVPSTPLAPGEHVLRFETVGAEGQTASSAPLTVKVTTSARAVEPPTIQVPTKGEILPGMTLSGSAPAGSRLEVYDGDKLVTALEVGPNGQWRVTLPKTLSAGEHEYRVVVVDSAGIVVSQSEILPLEVTAPLTLPITGAER